MVLYGAETVLIAAQALAIDCAVVTGNEREFLWIGGLLGRLLATHNVLYAGQTLQAFIEK